MRSGRVGAVKTAWYDASDESVVHGYALVYVHGYPRRLHHRPISATATHDHTRTAPRRATHAAQSHVATARVERQHSGADPKGSVAVACRTGYRSIVHRCAVWHPYRHLLIVALEGSGMRRELRVGGALFYSASAILCGLRRTPPLCLRATQYRHRLVADRRAGGVCCLDKTYHHQQRGLKGKLLYITAVLMC
jgi:hypothetical protein